MKFPVALLCLTAAGIRAMDTLPAQNVQLPELIKPVDVLVVGGSAPAVFAASEIAKSGTSVALVAPRPFLGDDLCDTAKYTELRKYLKSQNPILASMAQPPPVILHIAETIPFNYTANKPSNKIHKDTEDFQILKNRQLKAADVGSVQYDDDTDITITLEQETTVDNVIVYFYQRSDFSVDTLELHAINDDNTTILLQKAQNPSFEEVCFNGPKAVKINAKGIKAKKLLLKLTRPNGIKRMLLSEICVQTPELAAKDQAKETDFAPYPLQVKRVLDALLLDNNVKFVTSSIPVDVLKDVMGNVAAVVFANKSGLQIVKAKYVIDATDCALVAKLAGVEFRPYKPQTLTATRYVLGGKLQTPSEGTFEKVDATMQIPGGNGAIGTSQQVWKYTLDTKMDTLDIKSIMELENKVRDNSWDDNIVEQTARLATRFPLQIVSLNQNDLTPGTLNALRPKNLANLILLSHCADCSKNIAPAFDDLEFSFNLAKNVASFAANIAKKSIPSVPVPKNVFRQAQYPSVKPLTLPHRFDSFAITTPLAFPVLAEVDVAVVGGGTGGAPAAIAAARQGVSTLLVEYLYDLGGTSTIAGITRYYYGNICGFTAEMDAKIGRAKSAPHDWSRITKAEWYRSEIRKAGGEIWTGCLVFGTVLNDQNTIAGIAVATPFGPAIIKAKTVIDSTGNSDIAAAAGAQTQDQNYELAVQGTGLSPQRPGDHYINTDYIFSDDSDIIDVCKTFILGRERYKNEYDLASLIGSRERRRIVGDFIISPLDIFNQRTYPDTICVSRSNFDSHGYTVHPLFTIQGPDRNTCFADVPFRALLPKNVNNLMVTGLGISGHRDAMPILRMQPDIQNHGYAAGYAAAIAAKDNCSVRNINLKKLQEHLVEIGNIPQRVLTDKDSYPLPNKQVADAVATLHKNDVDDAEKWKALATVLVSMDRAAPLLTDAYKHAELPQDKLNFALILALTGNNEGADTLLHTLRNTGDWDQGWNYRGMGQFGPSLSTLDAIVIALGALKHQPALQPILEKAQKLTKDNEFSHFRAVSIALQQFASAEATDTLVQLINKEEIKGHHQLVSQDPRQFAQSRNPDYRRTKELREIFLAAALYASNPKHPLAKEILNNYANDYRGIYARHAKTILKSRP